MVARDQAQICGGDSYLGHRDVQTIHIYECEWLGSGPLEGLAGTIITIKQYYAATQAGNYQAVYAYCNQTERRMSAAVPTRNRDMAQRNARWPK
jgi:hypothetical protein